MTLPERLHAVRSAVAEAASQAGRDPAEITTIVVTKFQPVGLIRELAALGVRDFGESRHQEASAKAVELADLGVRWHFVGQLQANKAKRVRAYADVIHSVDRDALVDALTGDDRGIDCFIQVALSEDTARGGVPLDALERLTEHVCSGAGLRLRGVMAVAPLGAEPREAFARLRKASERVSAIAPEATDISAGMSGDFREAILEGATHLRIGTAITGNRPPRL
jgi:PLP dependent protein